MWTIGSDVTGDAAVMAGRQSSFVWMLLCILWKIMVSVSPMVSIRLYCKYFDDNKLYLVALMY
jgi:hypothetical protein